MLTPSSTTHLLLVGAKYGWGYKAEVYISARVYRFICR